jgi:hypothetical protein
LFRANPLIFIVILGGGEDSPEFEEPATPVKPAVKQRPRLSAVLRNADAKNKFTLGK